MIMMACHRRRRLPAHTSAHAQSAHHVPPLAPFSSSCPSTAAGVVVDEDFARTPAFAKTLADLPGPKAGFNSVGGVSGGVVAKALGAGASFVTYGSASRQAVRLPASLFTGKGLVARGFNLEAALAGKPKAARDAAVQAAIADVRGTPKEAKVKLLLAREPFADFGAALKRATTRGQRKVVLVMPTA